MTRSLLTVAAALPLALGCGYRDRVVGQFATSTVSGGGAGGGAPAAGAPSGGAAALPFILGADLSWVQEQEASGLEFVEAGAVDDPLAILARHGFNAVRLRLFYDPSSPCHTSALGNETCGYQYEFGARAEPFCDLDHTLAMAARVQAAGMCLTLDLHYSDTWADPDDQNKPVAWETLDSAALAVAVESYTADTLATFVAAGVTPDLVQLGNEITAGFLYPDGASTPAANFPRFTTLLAAAIAGARAATPQVPILLHLDRGNDLATSEWWLDGVLESGLTFDVLGQSCYPEWQGTSAEWIPTFDALAARYPKLRFAVAEYSQEKRAVNDLLYALPDRRGIGSFVWEPTSWGETLFDRVGDRLVANDLLGLYDQMARDYGNR